MKELLALKAEYKSVTGADWSPNAAPAPAPAPAQQAPTPAGKEDPNQLNERVKACGDKVRDLKAKKADKVNIF